MDQVGPPTLFVHIPKTAGTTMRTIIRRVHAPGEAMFLHREDRNRLLAEYESEVSSGQRTTRMIVGHIPFHEARLVDDFRFATMVREPVLRVISQHSFAMRNPHRGIGTLAMGMPIEEFVRAEGLGRKVNNMQTRFLGGARSNDPVDLETLIRAKENIERHFVIAGVTDRFDESVVLMRRILGWERWPLYSRRNVAPVPTHISDLPDGLTAYIAEHNQLDAELYHWINERLSRAIAEEGPSFERDLRAFRSLNSPTVTNVRRWAATSRPQAVRIVRKIRRNLPFG